MIRICERVVLSGTFLLITSVVQADLQAPVLQWGPTTVNSAGSAYYLNDNVVGGNVLGGVINYGLYEQSKSGAVVHSFANASAAKSATQIGNYVYYGLNTGSPHCLDASTWSNDQTCHFYQGGTDITSMCLLASLASDGAERLFGSSARRAIPSRDSAPVAAR